MPKRDPVTYAEVNVLGRNQPVVDAFGRIDLDDLEEEWSSTGAEALWIGILHARAVRSSEGLKVHRDILEAQLGRQYRDAAEARAVRSTDASIKEQIHADPLYGKACLDYLDAQEKTQILEAAMFGLIRKDQKIAALSALLTDEVRTRRPPPPGFGMPDRVPSTAEYTRATSRRPLVQPS